MTYTQLELNEILRLHGLWLKSDSRGKRADFSGADFSYADLTGADFSYANFSGAIIHNTIGNNKQIKSLQIGTYLVTYTDKILQIGCKQYPIADWWQFDNKTIAAMDFKAFAWWQSAKPILQTIIEQFPAES